MTTTYSDHSIRRILDLSHNDTCHRPEASQHTIRRTRRRTLYSARALDKMEAMFEENPYPDIEAREKLSLEFGVPEAKIQVWFQNRRTRRGCTKPRRGPRTLFVDQKRHQHDSPFQVPVIHPIAAYPPVMLPRTMLLPTPLLDYSPLDWTTAWCGVQRPLLRPRSKLGDLLIGELRSYEVNSSNSGTDDSQGNISV